MPPAISKKLNVSLKARVARDMHKIDSRMVLLWNPDSDELKVSWIIPHLVSGFALLKVSPWYTLSMSTMPVGWY